MSESGGYPLSLSFGVSLPVGAADELTVGGVWGPAVVESLSLDQNGGFALVRGFAMASRMPLRQGLATGEVVSADAIFVTSHDGTSGYSGTAYTAINITTRLVEIGKLVPWGPWWLVLRVENGGGVVLDVFGTFKLRVLDRLERVVPEAFERDVALGAGYGRLGGRNPHGLVAGYRSWV